MEKLNLVKEGSSYSLQVEKGKAREAKSFIFGASLPLANSVKNGISKTLERISAMGYGDFPDRQLFQTSTYLLKKPGKMLRSGLILLGAKLVGEEYGDFVDIAAAAEMLHVASLLHDDIIDNGSVRRGMQTTHLRYGVGAAILSGDALIAKAVALSARYGGRVVETMANAALEMCAGELLDSSYQHEEKTPSVREYLKIARLKTGTFMGTCCSVPAIYKQDKLASGLYGFGLNLGVAFQIRDDIIEVVDSEERRRNGSDSGSWESAPNLVRTFKKQFKAGTSEALEKSVGLNNYFAEAALSFIGDEKARKELGVYIDFVRIKES